MPLGAVTGLASEARILRRLGIAAIAAPGDPSRIHRGIERLVAGGATRLLSFGIAGGLDSVLAPGSLLLPRRVLSEAGDAVPVDAAWHEALRARLVAQGIVVAEGDLIGLGAILRTPAEKAALHLSTGAASVDLESHVVAADALRRGLPFLVLRAVADGAEMALPPAAEHGLDAEGRTTPLPVLRALMREPGQFGSLVRLAAATRAALQALGLAAPLLSVPPSS